MATSTSSELASQWINPGDVSTILLALGGDVVQKAFSQGTGKVYVPVCFSFGCVAYAFIALVSIIGDGRLLSPPDYPCKVFNLKSGYPRESKSFVLSRLLRDLEAIESRNPDSDADTNGDYDPNGYALRISVFEAMWNGNGRTQFSWTWIHFVGFFVTIVQFTLAAIPIIVHGTWSVLLITGAGTALVQWTGLLPQWRAEKLPNRQRSHETYALTSGNGSREVMVILGNGNCLDLESLAASQSPRNGRPWEKFKWLSQHQQGYDQESSMPRRNTFLRKATKCQKGPFKGFPVGFIITQVSCGCLSVLWLLLLVNVSARSMFPESWCLIGVGALGMFQNAWLAARELSPEMRNIPLKRVDQIRARKVMDCIMDFHITYKLGEPLRDEFFPGKLRPAEEAWWEGDFEKYDEERRRTPSRGRSRREIPEKTGDYYFMEDGLVAPELVHEKTSDLSRGKQKATDLDLEEPHPAPGVLPRAPTLEFRKDSMPPPALAA
ncbi:hypothetical protein CDV36_010099 [Fusarium kuroshium]|uniref:Uncharacterized protein n=1 Tax=Fusarium kuroshium TaxID=2010991 RepID=A0A3M2RY94_9HYPO|nr:hypothetical protein CDV36_010099 [Fusarium kuroshium]